MLIFEHYTTFNEKKNAKALILNIFIKSFLFMQLLQVSDSATGRILKYTASSSVQR